MLLGRWRKGLDGQSLKFCVVLTETGGRCYKLMLRGHFARYRRSYNWVLMHSPTSPPAISPTEHLLSTTYSLRPINGHTLELTPTGAGFCLLGSGIILLTFLGWGVAWHAGWLPRHVTMMSVGMSTVPTVVLVSYLVLRSLCGRGGWWRRGFHR